MKLTKCPNGHFYDADKHSECPYCNGGLETGSAIARPGAAAEAGLAAAPKGPVTGWLVVLDGPRPGGRTCVWAKAETFWGGCGREPRRAGCQQPACGAARHCGV